MKLKRVSAHHKLQFITHKTETFSYIDSARMALEGGCRWIQLRMKEAEASLLEETAVSVQQMCRAYGATFIVDDHVWLAKMVNADGVHLGKDDMSIAEARNILGDSFIIGATVNTFEDVWWHVQHVAPDYFGCGPFRFTSTKKNLAPILGFEGYRNIIHDMRGNGIDTPLVAIGGVGKEDIPRLLACGVAGVALSGSVLQADDPIREMREMVDLVGI